MSKKTLLVRVNTDNNKFSAWSKPMEEFVSSKKDRIIKVHELDGYQKGYYKCDELDCYVFHDMMFTVVVEASDKLTTQDILRDSLLNLIYDGLDISIDEHYLTDKGFDISFLDGSSFHISIENQIKKVA